jgi:hypothetical protein
MKAPDLARAPSLMVKTDSVSEIAAETSTLGFNHAELGSALLGRWKIPESIQIRCRLRSPVQTSHQDETSIIYLANQLTYADTSSEDSIREAMSVGPCAEKFRYAVGVMMPVCADVKEPLSHPDEMFFGG